MKVIIVGCKGFIGSHMVDYFKQHHDVWGCDVFTDYNEHNFILINPSNTDFHTLFSHHKFDVCINCSGAASVPDSLKDPARDFELNVHNVFLLLEAIRLHNRSCKFINLSSAAVYGNPTRLPVNEDHPLMPLSPYGFHKKQSEELCFEYHKFFQVPTCSIRIFSAYGPGLKKQILWDLFQKSRVASTIDLFGTGDESRDYIFIDDISFAVECLINDGAFSADIYNLGHGQAHTLKDVSHCFFDKRMWNGKVNFMGVKRLGDPDYWQADISKMKALGFFPKVTLEEGIQKYVTWLSSLG